MLSKKSLFLCSPNSVSHHDPSLCLIKMNWSFIFLFLHISSHLHFPPMNLKKRFSDRFPTEMGSDIPRHNGGGQISHGGLHSLCDAFWLAENWKCFHSIGSATFWVTGEITVLMPNWDWYWTLKSDREQLCLTLCFHFLNCFLLSAWEFPWNKQGHDFTSLRAPTSLSDTLFLSLLRVCMDKK